MTLDSLVCSFRLHGIAGINFAFSESMPFVKKLFAVEQCKPLDAQADAGGIAVQARCFFLSGQNRES